MTDLNPCEIGRNNRLFNDRMDRCRLLSCDIAYLLMYQLGHAVSDTESYYKLQLYLRGKRLFFLNLLPFGTKSFLPKIKCFSSLPPLMLRFSCIFTIVTKSLFLHVGLYRKVPAINSLGRNDLEQKQNRK